jgi:hypothetical protein
LDVPEDFLRALPPDVPLDGELWYYFDLQEEGRGARGRGNKTEGFHYTIGRGRERRGERGEGRGKRGEGRGEREEWEG